MLDPASGSWIATAALPRRTSIDDMVALAGGTVLAVGTFDGETEPTPVAYVYDPAAGRVVRRPGTGADSGITLVALPDGRALAIGGSDGRRAVGRHRRLDRRPSIGSNPGRGVWADGRSR